jgi:hypothetical protein
VEFYFLWKEKHRIIVRIILIGVCLEHSHALPSVVTRTQMPKLDGAGFLTFLWPGHTLLRGSIFCRERHADQGVHTHAVPEGIPLPGIGQQGLAEEGEGLQVCGDILALLPLLG